MKVQHFLVKGIQTELMDVKNKVELELEKFRKSLEGLLPRRLLLSIEQRLQKDYSVQDRLKTLEKNVSSIQASQAEIKSDIHELKNLFLRANPHLAAPPSSKDADVKKGESSVAAKKNKEQEMAEIEARLEQIAKTSKDLQASSTSGPQASNRATEGLAMKPSVDKGKGIAIEEPRSKKTDAPAYPQEKLMSGAMRAAQNIPLVFEAQIGGKTFKTYPQDPNLVKADAEYAKKLQEELDRQPMPDITETKRQKSKNIKMMARKSSRKPERKTSSSSLGGKDGLETSEGEDKSENPKTSLEPPGTVRVIQPMEALPLQATFHQSELARSIPLSDKETHKLYVMQNIESFQVVRNQVDTEIILIKMKDGKQRSIAAEVVLRQSSIKKLTWVIGLTPKNSTLNTEFVKKLQQRIEDVRREMNIKNRTPRVSTQDPTKMVFTNYYGDVLDFDFRRDLNRSSLSHLQELIKEIDNSANQELSHFKSLLEKRVNELKVQMRERRKK